MKILVFLSLVLVMLSCGSKPKEKAFDKKKAKPEMIKVKTDTVKPDTTINISYVDTSAIKVKMDSLVNGVANLYEKVAVENSFVLDRFGNKSFKIIRLKRRYPIQIDSATQSYPEVSFRYFEYSDTTQIKNVLKNWYHSFGEDRIEIVETINLFNVNSDQIEVYRSENQLFVINSSCLNYNNIIELLKSEFKSVSLNNWEKLFVVNCEGELIW